MQLLRPRCWWRMEESNPRAAHTCCAADDVTASPRFPAPFSVFLCRWGISICTGRLSGCQNREEVFIRLPESRWRAEPDSNRLPFAVPATVLPKAPPAHVPRHRAGFSLSQSFEISYLIFRSGDVPVSAQKQLPFLIRNSGLSSAELVFFV